MLPADNSMRLSERMGEFMLIFIVSHTFSDTSNYDVFRSNERFGIFEYCIGPNSDNILIFHRFVHMSFEMNVI